ncbi:MAG: CoA pyrophosphatase [Bacteroidota bacterium]
MRGQIHPEHWKQALREKLPGEEAQLKMAPVFRGAFEHTSDPVPAAVLILMLPFRGETRLVFIKRNVYDGPHSAQVSFPGGAWEPGDLSLEDTALRETREELGITGKIELLGSLTPLQIPVSNFMVTPFAGWMAERPAFHPDPVEVQYIIEAPLTTLQNPSNISSGTWQLHGRSIEAPFYMAGKEKIWGATAMMLCEFLQLTATLQAHRC